VEPVHGALHPQARQLAEPSGDRHQPVLPAMPGPPPDRQIEASLRKETRAWNRRMNRDRVPIQWEFTHKKARNTFGYTITRSRH